MIWGRSTREELLASLKLIIALLFWMVDWKWFAYLFFGIAIVDTYFAIYFSLLEVKKKKLELAERERKP